MEGTEKGLPRDVSNSTVASYGEPIQVSRSQEPLISTISTESMQSTGGSSAATEPVAYSERMEEIDDSGGACGWFIFRPRCLQHFRTPRWVLFWLCWAGALQGLIVNGFINVVITTIEKRYELKSTESGLIAGSYDIASFLCLVPVSYLGGSRSKPLFIGTGVLVLALGSFVFSLPHFAAGQYSFSQEKEAICNGLNSTVTCHTGEVSQLSNYKYLFLLGQLLHGAGATPLYTIGCTYLDENVPTKMSSLYIGIYYTMAIIGPALGFLIGGQLLKIYTDIGVNPKELGLTPSSNVWVGAWWVGFVIAAFIGVLVAIPISAFPKILPGFMKIKAAKISEMHQSLENSAATQVGFGTRIKDLPQSFKFLILNPTFVFLSLGGATEGMLVAGLSTFLPKVIEYQYVIPASRAAFLVGIVTIPGAGGGTFLGGYLVKKFHLKCAEIMKMCIVFSLICVGFTFGFIMSCPNADFSGVNVNVSNSEKDFRVRLYPSFGFLVSSLSEKLRDQEAERRVQMYPKVFFTKSSVSELYFNSHCNNHCKCSDLQYDPICGTNNIIYYSPCFAGCQNSHPYKDSKAYSNCSCIKHEGKSIKINGSSITVQATREKCTNNCAYIALFLVFVFFSMLFTFLVSMPSLSATLRCVPESQKSFALGIQWIAVRLLGTIPAPIIFGSLIDQTCILWQRSCNKKGACLFYDNKYMSRNMLIMSAMLKVLSFIFFLMAWLLYKPPGKNKAQENGAISPTVTNESISSTANSLILGQVSPNAPVITDRTDVKNSKKRSDSYKVWSTQDSMDHEVHSNSETK